MIWSRYNVFVKYADGYSYLFNCRVKRWLKLADQLADFLEQSTRKVSLISTKHPDLFRVLTDNHFIVESHQKEIADCFQEIKDKLSNPSSLKLTVNPTLDCNLRCWYCYESHLKDTEMSQDTIEAVDNFVKRNLTNNKFNDTQLSLFGGEPLLKFNEVVLPLIEKVSDTCKKCRVKLSISITTNGVNLTEDIQNYLKSLNIPIYLQIPYDGDSHYHNITKRTANRKETFHIVFNNTITAINNGFNVSVRCNYTKDNLESFGNLILAFESFLQRNNLQFSFHKIWQENNDEILKEKIINLKSKIAALKFNSNIHSHFGNSINHCYGDYAPNYVINYNGDVFKCTARDFTPENRIGFLSKTGEIMFNKNALTRLQNVFTSDCYACRRLPFCPICSQIKAESENGRCPIDISEEAITSNMKQYFWDLITQYNS